MRDVLLDLADDLSRGIVVEWLDPADVAHLDSAYNNHEKSEVFRGLLSSPLTLFDVSVMRGNVRWVRWAIKRRLHLGSIEWSSSVPEDVWTSIALTSCLDRLRVLDTDYSDGMSDALLLPILNRCRNSLKELRFPWWERGVTATSAAPIGECSELEVFQPNDAVTSRPSEIIGGLPKLRECTFSSSSSLTDEGVTDLTMSCPDLEILFLSNCRNISDAAIASLVQHSRGLKKLDLSNNGQLTDAALACPKAAGRRWKSSIYFNFVYCLMQSSQASPEPVPR